MAANSLTSLPTVAIELQRCAEAVAIGNDGLARVCARRAVGLAAIAAEVVPAQANAMTVLRHVAEDTTYPSNVRLLASSLLNGERARLSGTSMIADPGAAALTIIQSFACQSN